MKIKPVFVTRRVFVLFGCLMLAAFLFSACQPTPETVPVVNKGDNHLEEIIAASTQTPLPTPTADPAKTKEEQDEALRLALREKLGAPQTYSDSFENKNGRVAVSFDDAAVVVPAVQSIPAVALKPCVFSSDMVNRYAAYFLKGAPVFTQEHARTKEEIETEIIRLKQAIQDIKSQDNLSGNMKDYIKESEHYLKELEKQYQEAPEERAKTPATLDFVDTEEGQRIEVVADLGKEDVADFRFANTDQAGYFSFSNSGVGHYSAWGTPVTDVLPTGMTMTLSDATALAAGCLDDLDVENMQIDAVYFGQYGGIGLKSNRQCYHFEMERLFRGIPVTRIDAATPNDGDDPTMEKPQEPEFAEVVRPEWLFIQVDDTGIVDMQWTAPFDEDEVLAQNVTLLPFDEVVQKAKDNMFFQGYSASNCTAHVHITRIELGMMRIMRKDKPGDYMMVPVWDFIGNREQTVYGETDWLPFGDQSYVTINAIDGSHINREWGY